MSITEKSKNEIKVEDPEETAPYKIYPEIYRHINYNETYDETYDESASKRSIRHAGEIISYTKIVILGGGTP